jgi:hypothetical protein
METATTPLLAFPQTMAQLAFASWETIGYRLMLMAQGACTMAEYQLMTSEKVEALQLSMLALLTGAGHEEVVQPYLQRAQNNAFRLRAVSRERSTAK